MSHSRWIRFAATLSALSWLPLAIEDAAAQKIYRWTDEKGKVHFSNIAPSGEAPEAAAEPAPSAEEPEVGIVREAPPYQAEPPPQAAPTPEEKRGPYASLPEEQFSARVSEKRQRGRREVIDARRRLAEIDQELIRIRETRNRAIEQAMNMAGVTPPEQPDSPEEAELKKEREKVQKRIEEVNKEYAELHDEAVRRFGRQPDWWLALE